jgi:hypothetical protein
MEATMSDDYLDRDPGMYESDGAAFALVEQQRASVIDVLRTTKAASVTMLEENGDGKHWGIFIQDDGDAETFLVYAAARAVRDAAAALGVDHASACRLVLIAIEEGIGE